MHSKFSDVSKQINTIVMHSTIGYTFNIQLPFYELTREPIENLSVT